MGPLRFSAHASAKHNDGVGDIHHVNTDTIIASHSAPTPARNA
jgi:hypothetical protein